MNMEIKKGTRVMCLDAGGKPSEIKNQFWLEEGRVYTVVKVIKAKIQGRYGFVLEEIQTNDPLYFGYDVNRFGLSIFELEKLIAAKEVEVEEEVVA